MKKVLVTGLNNNQLPYLKELKKLGFKVIGTDLNKDAVGVKFCDKFVCCGYTETNKLIEICKEENFTKNDKVFSASSQTSYLALSEVASYFSIPFPSKDAIETAIGKKLLYQFFEKHKIPYPKTEIIYNENSLKEKLENKNYYLKSDYSKNPNYIYKIENGKLDFDKVVWKKDRYLKECYILQEEFIGKHLRFNIFGDYFTTFPFDSKVAIEKGQIEGSLKNLVKQLKIPNTLKFAAEKLGFSNFLIKFDVILSESKFVVLDIGIDPPYRMRNYYQSQNLNFVKMYVKHYILGEITYPIKEKI